jgi:hypothetical protein
LSKRDREVAKATAIKADALALPHSMPVMYLDDVSIWVGKIGMGEHPPVLASNNESPAVFSHGRDSPFIVFKAW